MEHAFVVVVLAVGVIGVLGAVLALLGSPDAWRALGRDGLVKDSDGKRADRWDSPAEDGNRRGAGGIEPELVAEIRQLVLARNHWRARRGLPALDVKSEIARQIANLNG